MIIGKGGGLIKIVMVEIRNDNFLKDRQSERQTDIPAAIQAVVQNERETERHSQTVA